MLVGSYNVLYFSRNIHIVSTFTDSKNNTMKAKKKIAIYFPTSWVTGFAWY